jgi:hypothetical protein
MKNLIIIITTIICTTILFGCNKTKTAVLPPATTTGANTFGCKVNGVVCATKIYAISGEGVTYTGWFGTQDSSLIIMARTKNPDFFFSFNFKYDTKTGVYVSKGSGGGTYCTAFYDYSNGSTASIDDNTFYTDTANIATISVSSFDLIDKAVSGTFAMNVVNKFGKRVSITEGRFDINDPY